MIAKFKRFRIAMGIKYFMIFDLLIPVMLSLVPLYLIVYRVMGIPPFFLVMAFLLIACLIFIPLLGTALAYVVNIVYIVLFFMDKVVPFFFARIGLLLSVTFIVYKTVLILFDLFDDDYTDYM